MSTSWLHRYAVAVACATFVLVIAGGLVTSTGSGLAVPDWPLSFGQVFPRMEGGVLFEHGHRLIASAVGVLTVGLAIWTQRAEPRRWVRRLGWAMVGAVILQGVLGGLTVLFLLPDAISVAHAGLAQIFFTLTVVMAVVSSPSYVGTRGREDAGTQNPGPSTQNPVTCAITTWTAVAIYVQILLGAIVRHTGAGLAIPTFPLANGRLIPDFTSVLIFWQFLHRAFAVVVAIMVVWTVARIFRRHGSEGWLTAPAAALIAVLGWQIFLGALTIWTFRAVSPTTAHVASGALLLVVSVLLAVRAHRVLGESDAPVEPTIAAAAAR